MADEPRENPQQKVCFSKELVPCKLLSFFAEAAAGSFDPFLNLFYVSSGLTAATTGLSNGISSCFALIVGPLWGAIIDSTKHRKFLSIFLWCGSTLSICSKPWIVMLVAKVERNVTCVNNTNVSVFVETTKEVYHSKTRLQNPDFLFYTILGMGILSSVFSSGVLTYMDGVIVNVIYTRKTEHSYGHQKVFAPIGYALGSFLSGLAIDNYKPKNLSPYAAAVYVYLPFSVMILPLMLILTRQAKWSHGKESTNKTSIRKHLLSVLKIPDNIMFLMSVVISGFLFCVYFEFLSLFMEDTMNPSKTIISLTSVTAVLSELSFYLFSSRIIKICGGPIACVFLGILSYVPRFLLTSYCTNAWYMLPIQLFHGIGLSLSWSAQIEHTYTIFPKEVTTTALGLLLHLHFVASSIVTNIAGGQIYKKYGGRKLFRGAACVGATWCLLMILYFGVSKCRRSKHKGYRTLLKGSVEVVDDATLVGGSAYNENSEE